MTQISKVPCSDSPAPLDRAPAPTTPTPSPAVEEAIPLPGRVQRALPAQPVPSTTEPALPW